MCCAWRTGICLVVLAGEAQSQIHNFFDEPVTGRTLSLMSVFHVFSEEDLPETAGETFAKFSGLIAKASDGSSVVSSDNQGVQIALIRTRLLNDLINMTACCSDEEDVKAGRAKTINTLVVKKKADQTFHEAGVYVHTVKVVDISNSDPELSQSNDEKVNILATGAYTLALANCNDFDLKLSGTVIVKNGYGFLPASEYFKMSLYGWLLVVYIVSGLVWFALSVRWWAELFNVQLCIGAVIFLAILESFVWFVALQGWNRNGERGMVMFSVAILLSVVKSIFSYMLVLVASLGWGVTQPYLDSRVVHKLKLTSVGYIGVDFIRQSVTTLNTSYVIPQKVLVLVQLPVAIMYTSIFVWVYTSLQDLMLTLKDRGQTDKLVLFQRLWTVLCISIAIALVLILYEFIQVSQLGAIDWRERWFFSDGAMHLLFCCVLFAMMFLWAPHKNSQRYAYSRKADETESVAVSGDRPNSPWADDHDMDDGEDEDSFWAATRKEDSLAVPELIGSQT
jgi:hypothetical protein